MKIQVGEVEHNRFAELDLLRFLAAIAVVFYHYTARDVSKVTGSPDTFQSIATVTKFGYLGVELFFMISGFVILASALNRSAIDFLISRATRLYPTYWAAMLLTTLVVMWLAASDRQVTPVQFLANLSMFNDYLGIPDIDGVYWTLHAELKFYFCVFALIVLRWIQYYKIWIGLWLLLTVAYLLTGQPSFMGWFISPGYSSYFIAGAVFYLARKQGMTPYYALLLGTSLVVSLVYAYEHAAQFMVAPTEVEKYTAAAVVLVFYLVFFCAYQGVFTMKSSATLLLIGGLTYPLYLIHGRVGRLAFDNLALGMNPYLALGLVLLIMLAVSYWLHLHVEKTASNALKRQLMRLKGWALPLTHVKRGDIQPRHPG